MEENVKKEYKTETISGYLGKDAELNESKNEKKMVLSFSIANNLDKEKPKWTNVQMWEKEATQLKADLKTGDYVEITGYHKEYPKKDGSKGIEFVAKEVMNHKKKPEDKLKAETPEVIKGNLGNDPLEKTVKVNGEDKKVLVFSVAKKEGEKIVWTQCQVWEEKIEKTKANELTKGDFVKLEGRLGKEYETKNGEKRRDLMVTDCQLLKKNLNVSNNTKEEINESKGMKR